MIDTSKYLSSQTSCISILRTLLLSIMLSGGVVFIVMYSIDLYINGQEKHLIGYFSAGGFVLLTFPISINLILSHLSHWYRPNIQKFVVRIIWMVPLYSIESFLALRFRAIALYIRTIRECYEAYVIYNFLYFLIALLGNDENSLIKVLRSKPDDRGKHKFPVSMFLNPWHLGELLQKCKVGVLQYVVCKNLTAMTIFIMESCGVYNEGTFTYDSGYIYVCIINNASQLWALYCLILFYITFKEELTIWRPIGKFLCVKSVVFFTWWQSIAINIVSSLTTVIDSKGDWSGDEIAKGLQDYLICIEMFIAALAFHVAFTYKDYVPKSMNKDKTSSYLFSALVQSSIPDDLFSQVHLLAKGEDLILLNKDDDEYDNDDEDVNNSSNNDIKI